MTKKSLYSNRVPNFAIMLITIAMQNKIPPYVKDQENLVMQKSAIKIPEFNTYYSVMKSGVCINANHKLYEQKRSRRGAEAEE